MASILTRNELQTLTEALDAWIEKDTAGDIIGSLFGAMIADKASPESKEQIKRDETTRREEATRAKESRKEEATILKAKLITLRREMESNFIGSLAEPSETR